MATEVFVLDYPVGNALPMPTFRVTLVAILKAKAHVQIFKVAFNLLVKVFECLMRCLSDFQFLQLCNIQSMGGVFV